MTLKTYAVRLGAQDGAERDVTVRSPTDVQAGDAARPLMQQGESILAITLLKDAPAPDAAPPKTQAAELAPVTPGMAAAPNPTSTQETDHG